MRLILLLTLLQALSLCVSAQPVKWTELKVQPAAKRGFTLLPPEQTGIRFTNRLDESASAANRTLENGSGVAIGDVNGDGRPDIFFCSLDGTNKLFLNLGNWRFEDRTDEAGLRPIARPCRGAVFADLDGNGTADLLVSTSGGGVLCFLGDGQGRFAEKQAGTASAFGSMTMALADVDGDGTLDLYVTNYRAEDIRDRSRIDIMRVNGRVMPVPALQDRLLLTPGGVQEYGEPDALYLNNGRGEFRAVSWTVGAFRDELGQPLTEAAKDWGLSGAFHDLNGDGLPDLYVCNDYWTPDRLWLNDGKGRFKAAPKFILRHTPENSMGVAFGDVDADGHMDFLVLDMLSRDQKRRRRQALAQTRTPGLPGLNEDLPQFMRNCFFHNRGDDTFEEIAAFSGIQASDWSWQPAFIDVDLDGYLDLLISAGHRNDVQDLDATAAIKARQHPWPNTMDARTRQESFTREMMENARLYPSGAAPIHAFRNAGGLRFEEATQIWGTSQSGVHQGFAFADLDGDGDLDCVVNNLGAAAGVYQNIGDAPRLAVRLRGAKGNTAGIGAVVRLEGQGLPLQTREVTSGGMYLSGSDPLLVFAAGNLPTRLEIRWRSGAQTIVTNLGANRLYEISEAGAGPAPAVVRAGPAPLFEDASRLLAHAHVESAFDDFAAQPLLPRRLSQSGPGLCWFDLNGDGFEDLAIGGGAGGTMAIFLSRGAKFEKAPIFLEPLTRDQTALVGWVGPDGQRLLLAGLSNYRDGLAKGPALQALSASGERTDLLEAEASAGGAIAMADLDGDGDLDLFIAGRLVPGEYPRPAISRLYRNENGVFRLDESNSGSLRNIGLVTSALFADLNADGFPELVLACEWGSLRIFENGRGVLQERTREWGLDKLTGLWTGIAAADLDEDGKFDLIVGNWGLNGDEKASSARPLKLFWRPGDWAASPVEAQFDAGAGDWFPRRGFDILKQGWPALAERFRSHSEFSQATALQLLAPGESAQATVATLSTTIFLNRGGHFEARELPREAQMSPVFGVVAADFDGDGHQDVFLAQNFFATRPEDPRLDAGRGLLLRGDGKGELMPVVCNSGIECYGQGRAAAACDYDHDGRIDLAVSQNGGPAKLFHNIAAKPGVRIKLRGPPANPSAMGALVRVENGPVMEVQAGGGYLSQDGSTLMAPPDSEARRLQVIWPGGKRSTKLLAPAEREVEIAWTP